MNADRRRYLRTVIDLYLEQPQTPATARRADWAIAASFYQQGTPLDLVLHTIRLATLRRLRRSDDSDGSTLEPIHSLAYYRSVLAALPLDALDPGYIAYVEHQHACLVSRPEKRGLAAKIPRS
jgi:hypothetical protein